MRRLASYLELAFRNAVVYPVFRSLLRNPVSNDRIDLHTIHKLLILRYDRIGDMIVTTPVFRNLKRLHPTLHIGVVTSEANAELIRFNPFVDTIYTLHSNWRRLVHHVRRARAEHYDVVLNFIFNRTTSGGLLANIIAPDGFKVGQGDEKYRFYFNRLLKLERSSLHMAETLAFMVEEVFGVTFSREDLGFEIVVDEASRESVDAFLRSHGLRRREQAGASGIPYIVLNLSATDAARRISASQARGVAAYLGGKMEMRTLVIRAPRDREMEGVMRWAQELGCIGFPGVGRATLLQIASLIGGAAGVVTPDTSIVHFASAMKTPVLGFFTPLQGMHEWLPYRVPHRFVTAPRGEPVSSIPLSELTAGIDDFLSGLHKDRREPRA